MSLQTNFSQYGIILSLITILHTVVKYHHFKRRNCFSQGIKMDDILEKQTLIKLSDSELRMKTSK